MKSLQLIFLSILIISCDNLERKNVLDQTNNEFNGFSSSSETSDVTSINSNAQNQSFLQLNAVFLNSETIEDGKINPGESVQIEFVLENIGALDATGVEVMFLCDNYFINDFYPTGWVNFSSNNDSINTIIYSGSTASSSEMVSFNVSQYATVGDEIEISLIIKDEDNNQWNQTFKTSITAAPPIKKVEFDRFDLSYEEFSDGIISRGEYVELRPFIKNTGNVTIYEPTVSVRCNNPYLEVYNAPSSVGYYQFDNSAGFKVDPNHYARPVFTSGFVKLRVSQSAPQGVVLVFDIVIVDATNEVTTESYSITIN